MPPQGTVVREFRFVNTAALLASKRVGCGGAQPAHMQLERAGVNGDLAVCARWSQPKQIFGGRTQ